MLRHLPPTATPLRWNDLKLGLSASPQALTHFQTALSQYLGIQSCFLASSGRTALYILLKSLSEAVDHRFPSQYPKGTLSPNTQGARCLQSPNLPISHQAPHHPARREVLLPAYTCPALVKVTLDAGLSPRLIDISPDTLAFKPGLLAEAIGQQTLAVIYVHPFGIPQPLEEVITLAGSVGAIVIEDAAQALGARLAGRPAGVSGDFGLFSLGPGKPLSTGGGGILCVNNGQYTRLLEEVWEKLLPPPIPKGHAVSQSPISQSPISNLPTSHSVWALLRLTASALAFHPVGWRLATRLGLHHLGEHEASWGYTLRGLTPAQAGVGLALLERLEAINQQRRENACRLIAHLQELDFVQFPCLAPTAEPIYLRLPVIVDSEERRERLFQRLWKAGLGVGRMYRRALAEFFPQLALHPPIPPYGEYYAGSTTETYPGAERVARCLLTLPTHHYLAQTDIDHIAQILRT